MNRLDHETGGATLIQEHLGALQCFLPETATDPWPVRAQYRAEAHLDALRIMASEASATVAAWLESDDTTASMAALLALFHGVGDDAARTAALGDPARLGDPSPEPREALRVALRLGRPDLVVPGLLQAGPEHPPVCRAMVAEVCAFHRNPRAIDLGPLLESDDPAVRLLAIEAAGRTPRAWTSTMLHSSLERGSDQEKRAALRASARVGLNGLAEICRARVAAATPCAASVRFLGIVGDASDTERLMRLLTHAEVGESAMGALADLGFVSTVDRIVESLSDPALGEPAAAAFEQITGAGIVRHPPAEPAGEADEESDFRDDPGEPDLAATREAWRSMRAGLSRDAKLAGGVVLSANVLTESYDALETPARVCAYLRTRALQGAQVADMEPETWWYRQRAPGAPWRPYNAESDTLRL